MCADLDCWFLPTNPQNSQINLLDEKEYFLEKTAIQVFEKRELKKKVNSLLFNKNYLDHIIKKQFTILKKYAIIDGQCVARNVSTILDILNQKKLKTSKY